MCVRGTFYYKVKWPWGQERPGLNYLTMNFGLFKWKCIQILSCSINLSKPNVLAYPYHRDKLISNLSCIGCYFSFFKNSNRTFCKQTAKILIRHSIMRCLIWFCNVCLCPIKKDACRYYDLIPKFQVRLKSLLHQGLSEPEFCGDLVYKLKKIVGSISLFVFSAVH